MSTNIRSRIVLTFMAGLGCGSGAAPGADIPDTPPLDSIATCNTAADCPTSACGVADCRDGVCVVSPVTDGTPCGADDPCLIAGRCESGTCVGTPRDCDDHDVCTIDSCEAGECRHVPGVDNTACEDGNSCTGPDSCKGGACVSGPNSCACVMDGDCEGRAHDPCLGTLACLGNVCVFHPGSRVVCPQSENPCAANICDSMSGKCVEKALVDGTPCTPEDPCFKEGSCKAGKCTGTPACPAGPCAIRGCDPGTGQCLAEQPAPDGTPCDDGNPCTGPDLCAGGTCVGGENPCDDGNACTSDSCNPADGSCMHAPLTGPACDDGDPCTTGDSCDQGACKGGSPPKDICNGKDDDCDGITDPEGSDGCVTYYQDSDGDDSGIPGNSRCLCTPLPPYTALQIGDCDDTDAAVHPGASETCNGKDDDCDGSTDPEDAAACKTYYRDEDADGWGVSEDAKCLCGPIAPHTAKKPGDCDDTAPAIHPEALEICNGLDDDCDGSTDPDGALGCAVRFKDADQDGYGVDNDSRCLCVPAAPYLAVLAGDCDDDNSHMHPKPKETCDGLDDDCDGDTDPENSIGCAPYMTDPDGDGYGSTLDQKCLCGPTPPYTVQESGDCAPDDPFVHPNAVEACNKIDDDCDGKTDPDGSNGCTVFFADMDLDGFGDDDSRCLCEPEGVYTATVSGDCNDHTPSIQPKAIEICDGIDNDCDDVTDPPDSEGCTPYLKDQDKDGYGGAGPTACLCGPATGYAQKAGDCDDNNADVHPGGRVCGRDGDCDGNALDVGETCEDGNTVDWDGCTACQISEFQVASYTDGNQSRPAVAALTPVTWLGFLVAWEGIGCLDASCNPPSQAVFARMFDSAGTPEGPQFLLNGFTQNPAHQPRLALHADGDFVATWIAAQSTGDAHVQVRMFTNFGIAKGAQQELSAGGLAYGATPLALADGRFAVAWDEQTGDFDADVFLQYFNKDGHFEAKRIDVNTDKFGEERESAASTYLGENIVVAWRADKAGGYAIRLQRFDGTGSRLGTETVVNENQLLLPVRLDVAGFMFGGFVVVWPAGFPGRIVFRKFDKTGAAETSETFADAKDAGDQSDPVVATILDGRFVVAWKANQSGGGDDNVYLRVFKADGSPHTNVIQANVFQANNQVLPAVSTALDGTIVLAWESRGQDGYDSGIFLQRFDPDGRRIYR